MRKVSPTLDADFNRFWACYPRLKAKLDAHKAWKSLNPSPELVETILEAVRCQREEWVRDKTDIRYVPYAASWLRAGRWMDEVTPLKASPVSRPAWVCPHVDQCGNREMCRIATELGRPHRAKESA